MNKPASYFGSIVGHENKVDRNENDFYPTPPIATFSLLKYWPIPQSIWEPAAGRGHISKELIRCRKTVYSSDMYSYDNPLVPIYTGKDFLSMIYNATDVNAIITNPPYKNKLAEKFLLRALELKPDVIAFLCRMQFMNSDTRYKSIFSKTPPTCILVFSKRINCNEEAAESIDAKDQLGGMLEYCWYIWDKNVSTTNPTIVKWIDLNRMVKEWNHENNKGILSFES